VGFVIIKPKWSTLFPKSNNASSRLECFENFNLQPLSSCYKTF
jgi:hypothetical protein